jgi:hypothetical protein
VFLRPCQQRPVAGDLEQGFKQVYRSLAGVEMLDRVDEIEVHETQQGACYDVAVDRHKVEYTTLAHGEGVGVFRGAAELLVQSF